MGENILQRKGIRVEDYANDITSGEVPLDELGILVVSRMYHIHIGIVLKDRVWYTTSENSSENCLFHLLYQGGVQFLDSCTANWGYASPKHALTYDLTSSPQAQPLDYAGNKENENESTPTPNKNPLLTLPLNLSHQPDSTVNQKLDELNQELDSKKDKENRKRNLEEPEQSEHDLKSELDSNLGKKNRRKQNLDKSIDSTGSSTSSRKRTRSRSSSSSRVLRSSTSSNRKKPKLRSSRTSRRAAKNKLTIDLDSLLCKNRTRNAKPKNLKEKDPILDALKKAEDKVDLEILLDPSDDDKKNKSIAVEENISTGDGVVNVKSYGLKRNYGKKHRKFPCSEENCSEVKSTQGELNRHLQYDHKRTFKCSLCDRIYDTANGRDKHFKKHFKYNNICDVCKYSCQFPGQLTVHMRKHTEDSAGKFPCPTRDCSSVLISKANLVAHQKIHQDTKFTCDECKKDYSTDLRYKQHMQGKHGNGCITLCGIKYQWPDSKYRHEGGDCEECKKKKQELKEKPDFPLKAIVRKRKQKTSKIELKPNFQCYCCGTVILRSAQTVSCKYLYYTF